MDYEQDAKEILKELKTDSEEVRNETMETLEICDKIKEKGKRHGELKYIEKKEEAEQIWKEFEKLFDELEMLMGEWIKQLKSEGVKK